MRVDRIEPRDAQAVRAGCGLVRCKVCGHEWVTEPAEDALLAKLFEHDATHDEGRVRYLSPAEVTPPAHGRDITLEEARNALERIARRGVTRRGVRDASAWEASRFFADTFDERTAWLVNLKHDDEP
jgi:hypothetical protein